MRNVQRGFAAACAEICAATAHAMESRDAWLTYLNVGAAEAAIAADHQGRYWLELLQNARDAIFQGRRNGGCGDGGRVLVGVTDHGLVVANTGGPFALHEPGTREAVQYLKRSPKSGTGFVGHKGIGLKSVLLRAGAFAVRTTVAQEHLRVTFSRARTAGLLLSTLARTPGLDHEQRAALRRLLDLLPAATAGPAMVPIARPIDPWEILAELPRLPLFHLPHPDGEGPEVPDEGLLEDLLVDGQPHRTQPEGLDEAGRPANLAGYTTVVYLPFIDPAWSELLRALPGCLPEPFQPQLRAALASQPQTGSGKPAARAWKELRNLDARVLVLLGEMAEVQLVRFEDGALREAVRYDIVEALRSEQRKAKVKIDVLRQHWRSKDGPGKPERSRLLVYSARTSLDRDPGDEGPPAQIRIVFEGPSEDAQESWVPSGKGQPLFLYYPITHARTGLPFVVHGPFHVSSSRTELADDSGHNAKVLGEARGVIERALRWLAGKGGAPAGTMPWLVAPCEDAPTDDEDLALFVRDVHQLCRELPLVPVERGVPRPGLEVLFDPAEPDAFQLFGQGAGEVALLGGASHRTYTRWRTAAGEKAADAAERLGLGATVRDPIRLAAALTSAWSTWKADHPGARHVEVPERPGVAYARALFRRLSALRAPAVADGEAAARAFAVTLGRAGCPLVLAERGPDQPRGTVRLVVAEDRTGPVAKTATGRVLFWREAAVGAQRVEAPTPPPIIPVYMADVRRVPGAVELLSVYWREWATTQFDGLPELFRRVAERLAEQAEFEPTVLGYLAALLGDLRSKQRSDDLRPAPFCGWSCQALHDLHAGEGGSTARRERFRVRMRLGDIRVPQAGGGVGRCRDLLFGPAWADLLRSLPAEIPGEPGPGGRWADAVRASAEFHRLAEIVPRRVANPDDPAWAPVLSSLPRSSQERSSARHRLLELLLLCGVQLGLLLRLRWLDPERTPDEPGLGIGWDQAARWTKGQSDAEGPSAAALREYVMSLQYSCWHSAFTVRHTDWCGQTLRRQRQQSGLVVGWAWSPDLEDRTEAWSDARAAAFVEVVRSLWPELHTSVLWTGQRCNYSGHGFRGWGRPVPSLLLHQLAEARIWPDAEAGPETPGRHAASVMVLRAEDGEGGRGTTELLPGFPARDDLDREMAADLGVVGSEQLSAAAASRRLEWLVARHVREVPSGVGWVALSLPSREQLWIGAYNRLVERLLSWPDVEGALREPWRRHDLGLRPFWLRGTQAREACAVRVVRGPDGLARLGHPAVVFRRRPGRRDLEAYGERVVLEAPYGREAEFAALALALGAEEGSETEAPAFPGDAVDAPDVCDALRKAVRERLKLLLGIARLHQQKNLDQAAALLLELSDGLIAVASAGPDGQWSGMTADRKLAFCLPSYRKQPGVAVLSEGLAEGMKIPSAALELEFALTAPVERVWEMLLRREPSLAEALDTVEALAAERDRQAGRRAELVEALVAATGSVPSVESMETLKDLARGATDAAALLGVLQRVARVARDAGGEGAVARLTTWPRLHELLRLGSAASLPGMSASEALHWTATASAVAEFVAEHEEGAADPASWPKRFEALLAELTRLQAVEGAQALQHRVEAAGLHWDAPPGRLFEWSRQAWEELADVARSQARSQAVAYDGPARPALVALTESGDPARLTHELVLVREALDAGLRDVDLLLDEGKLVFTALDAPGNGAQHPPVVPAAEAIIVGTGQHAGGSCIADRDVLRSRVAELFALEQAWRGFARLGPDARRRLLELVLELRGSNGGPPWSTPGGLHRAEALVERHGPALVAYQGAPAAAPAELRQGFRALLDVSRESGPGFDMIDPFFGAPPGAPWPPDRVCFRRVEVKALVPASFDEQRRFVLTTNEFRKARLDGSSYVLRLIEVPLDPLASEGVRTAWDIPDPVTSLELDRKFVDSVRGGTSMFWVRGRRGAGGG